MARENRSKWIKILAGIAMGLLVTASLVSTVLIPFLFTPSALIKTWYGLSAIASLTIEFFVFAAYAYKNKTSNNTAPVILANSPPHPPVVDTDKKPFVRSVDVTNDLGSKETKSSTVSVTTTGSESISTSSMSASTYSSIASSISNPADTSSTVSSTPSTISSATPHIFPLSFTANMSSSESTSSMSSSHSEFKEKEKKVFVPDPEPQPRDPETIIMELLKELCVNKIVKLWQELLSSDDNQIGNYIIQQNGPYQGVSILWLAFYKKDWDFALKFLQRAPDKSVDPNICSRHEKWQTLMYLLLNAMNFWLDPKNKNNSPLSQLEQIYDQVIDKSSKLIDLNRVKEFQSCFAIVAQNFTEIGEDTRYQRLEKLLNQSEPIDLNGPMVAIDSVNRKWLSTVFREFLDIFMENSNSVLATKTLKLLLEHANSAIDFNKKAIWLVDPSKECSGPYVYFFTCLFKENLKGKIYAAMQVLVREHKYPMIFSKKWTDNNPLVMIQLLSHAQNEQDHFTFLKLIDAGMYPPINKIKDWVIQGEHPNAQARVTREMMSAGGTAAFCTIEVLPKLLKAAESAQILHESLKLEMIFIGWIEFRSAKKNSQIPSAVGLMIYSYLVKPDQELLTAVQKFIVQGLEHFRKNALCRMVAMSVRIYKKNYKNVSGLSLLEWAALPDLFRLALDDRAVISDSLLQDVKFRYKFYEQVKKSAQSGKHLCVGDIEDLAKQAQAKEENSAVIAESSKFKTQTYSTRPSKYAWRPKRTQK